MDAIVLAGGRSSRMGQDKALLRLNGRTLLEHTVGICNVIADSTIVVADRADRYAHLQLDAVQVADDKPHLGPLNGLLAGMRHVRGESTVVVACDMPFLDRKVLSRLRDLLDRHDAVVPLANGRWQSLHAVYAARISSAIEQQLATGQHSMRELLKRLSIREYAPSEVERQRLLRSVTNVNTPDDFHQLTSTSLAGTGRLNRAR
jgi:molybdenum cofactor guanylyltransferase